MLYKSKNRKGLQNIDLCMRRLSTGSRWAKNEEVKPNDLPKLVYVDSNIETYFSGLENMRAFQLRKGSKSTRVYCKECFSILAVDHPNYNNERFMFFENHCSTTLDTSLKPNAITYLDHLPEGSKRNNPK